jgi:hypothetical protein
MYALKHSTYEKMFEVGQGCPTSLQTCDSLVARDCLTTSMQNMIHAILWRFSFCSWFMYFTCFWHRGVPTSALYWSVTSVHGFCCTCHFDNSQQRDGSAGAWWVTCSSPCNYYAVMCMMPVRAPKFLITRTVDVAFNVSGDRYWIYLQSVYSTKGPCLYLRKVCRRSQHRIDRVYMPMIACYYESRIWMDGSVSLRLSLSTCSVVYTNWRWRQVKPLLDLK